VSLLSDGGMPIEQISRLVGHSGTSDGAGPPETDPSGGPGRSDRDGPHLPGSRGVVTQLVTQ
jgi:hypothetical protein